VVTLPKEETLAKAVSEVHANTDRRGKRKIIITKTARDFAVDDEILR
jgi:hypothetical protein